MKQVSATDASRRFSEVLDDVEHDGGTGKALKEALRANRPDDAWADELRELRESMEPEADPWHD